MSLNHPSIGLNFGPVYQVSTIPFVTSSILVPALGSAPNSVSFPYVTKNLYVKNTGSPTIRVGFSLAGVTGSITNNYLTLGANESYESDFRVSSVFVLSHTASLTSSVTVVAGMTTIPAGELVTNWSGTSGIG